MACGKTEEEKRAEADAKAAASTVKEKAKAEAEYWASPVGQSVQARQRGDRFFQVSIPVSTPVSTLDGYSNLAWGSGDVSKTTHVDGATDTLGKIEEAGWRHEHASWVFIETGTSSRDKVLASGQKLSITGRVEGIYLFRSTQHYTATPPPPPL